MIVIGAASRLHANIFRRIFWVSEEMLVVLWYEHNMEA